MNVGIVVYSNDPETVWNAIRFGNFALAMGDKVKMFLIGKGVEVESVTAEKFNVPEQLKTFLSTGGGLFACGTCLELRQMKPSSIYKVSTLKDLYELIKESDKIITF